MAPRGSPRCIGAMPKAVSVTGRLGTGVHLVHDTNMAYEGSAGRMEWPYAMAGRCHSNVGKGLTMEYVITEGGERGRGGRARGPPCSPPEGFHPKQQ